MPSYLMKDFFAPSYPDLLYNGYLYTFEQHNKLNVFGKKINYETGEISETIYLQPKSLMHNVMVSIYPGEPLFYQEKIILPIYAINTQNINVLRNRGNASYQKQDLIFFFPLVLIQLDLDLNIKYVNFDYQDMDKDNGVIYFTDPDAFIEYNPETSFQKEGNKYFVDYWKCTNTSFMATMVDIYTLPLSVATITPVKMSLGSQILYDS